MVQDLEAPLVLAQPLEPAQVPEVQQLSHQEAPMLIGLFKDLFGRRGKMVRELWGWTRPMAAGRSK